MKSMTIHFPDYVEQPATIADYAFAQALTDRFGTYSEVIMTHGIASEQFKRCAILLNSYLNGIHAGTEVEGSDPYSPLAEYWDMTVGPEADPTWIEYISDARDA